MSNREKMLRTTMLAILAALLGFALGLAGCDGTGGGETGDGGAGPGLVHYANGNVSCEIPSPTGDQVIPKMTPTTTVRELVVRGASGGVSGAAWTVAVVSNASEAGSLCGGWPAGACNPAVDPRCAPKMTSSECADVDHDFVDSVGSTHCFTLVAGDGKSSCPPDMTGKLPCKLSAMGLWVPGNLKATEICSQDGKFIGWVCI